jgi:hypothetical protein
MSGEHNVENKSASSGRAAQGTSQSFPAPDPRLRARLKPRADNALSGAHHEKLVPLSIRWQQ